MNILYVGDVMGEAGLRYFEKVLPELKKEHSIDFVVVQAENVSEGRGTTQEDFKRLLKAGADACTGGNWSLYRDDIYPAFSDPNQPIVRPANYPEDTPGLGYKYVTKNGKTLLFASLLGNIVGRDSEKPMDNPLKIIDDILEAEKDTHKDAIVVNLHGDFSSEKVVIGHYLDGRVTLVTGDHWHVPTADARVLDGGTAHITDVGMCGALNSSLGVTYESVIPRWRDGRQTRNVLVAEGPMQFNSVLVRVNENGLADSIQQIQKYS